MNEKWKNRIIWFMKSWGFSFLIALLLATSIKSAIADWNLVPTGSMKPTIVEGDRIFVNKLAYDLKVPYTTWHIAEWDNPERGDIVVFFSPKDGKRMVKRVIGLPGDSIEMRDNQLLINGKEIKYEQFEKNEAPGATPEYYLFQEKLPEKPHPVMLSPYQFSFRSFQPITVPDNHYFMLGDNRDNSADSRYFGFVNRDLIIGQAIAVVMSLDKENYYKPRWKRFFKKLL